MRKSTLPRLQTAFCWSSRRTSARSSYMACPCCALHVLFKRLPACAPSCLPLACFVTGIFAPAPTCLAVDWAFWRSRDYRLFSCVVVFQFSTASVHIIGFCAPLDRIPGCGGRSGAHAITVFAPSQVVILALPHLRVSLLTGHFGAPTVIVFAPTLLFSSFPPSVCT